jgi:hypothetical protein
MASDAESEVEIPELIAGPFQVRRGPKSTEAARRGQPEAGTIDARHVTDAQ